jgi:hypothetical protein
MTQITRILTDTRMRRMKLNRGGDGDAHHRSTSERSYIDKLVCHAGPIGRMIPLAESPSSVRFRSNHPQKKNFWIKFLDNF